MSRRERQRRRDRHRGSTFSRVVLMVFVVGMCFLGVGLLGVAGWIVNVADSAPDINQLKPRDPGQLSEVFASNGTPLGYIRSDILRTVLPQQSLPRVLTRATVAIEDRRFWQHGGIDFQGILRAGVDDVLGGGRNIQGGSTLTMQLVRNIYLPYKLADTRTIKRKIIEAKLAEELESKRTKRWILAQYLNDVDYGTVGGQTAVGVGAASQLFFDKPAWKLDIAQAALLAGLPQAPSEYNPFLAPGLARARRHEVLTAMVKSDYITQAQANRADRSSLEVKPNDTYSKVVEPYVFDYVRQALIQRFGIQTVEKGGLKVYTTIDPKRQAEAEQAILAHEGGPGQPAAALASIDPTNGHIEALATSSKYGTGLGETTFNYAWQGHRQTGSAFKVFALMTLIHDYDGDPNKTYYNSHLLAPGWLSALSHVCGPHGRAQLPGQHQRHPRDDDLGQHRVRAARAGPRHGEGDRHRPRDGHQLAADRLPVRGAGRRRGLSARDGRRLRDDRQRRHPPSRHGDHEGRVPGRQCRQSRRLKGHPRVQPRRGLCGHPGDEDRDHEWDGHGGELRLPCGR